MLRPPARALALVCVAAVPLVISAFAQAHRPIGPTAIASWSISPAVVATFIAHGDPEAPEQIRERLATHTVPSGPVTLDVLILWRGSPGWFLHGGQPHDSGGGDSNGNVNVHLERAGIVLDATLDGDKRVLHVGRQQVVLGDANVVLVDQVDVPGALSIAGTRTVESRVQRPPEGLYDVFRGAQDLVPFLRCEAAGAFDTSCARIIKGK